ncbi:prefoldin subunit beta [archaeon]|nr:prefoldin subunit beta [archaeon]
MSAEPSLPGSLQEKLARLQRSQQIIAQLIAQRQRVEAELQEVTSAIEELEKLPDDAEVFKVVGPLLIRTSKEEALKSLKERKEELELHHSILVKQEKKERDTMAALQREIQEELPRTGS